jgi:hypothetical protein
LVGASSETTDGADTSAATIATIEPGSIPDVSGAGSNKKKPRRIHPRYIYEQPEELPERIREKKKLAAFIAKVLEPVPELKPLEFSAAWIEKQSGIEDAMAAVNRAEADYRRAREIDEEDDLLLLMI